MKASEIRDLGLLELKQKVVDLKQELFNLRFQHQVGQLENPQRLKETKRDIARLKTVIKEVAANSENPNE